MSQPPKGLEDYFSASPAQEATPKASESEWLEKYVGAEGMRKRAEPPVAPPADGGLELTPGTYTEAKRPVRVPAADRSRGHGYGD